VPACRRAEGWDVLEDIPNDSAAALLEHHWAVPLRDAIARAGGFRIGDGFISPLDLVEIGPANNPTPITQDRETPAPCAGLLCERCCRSGPAVARICHACNRKRLASLTAKGGP
jgi:hypothetical protein